MLPRTLTFDWLWHTALLTPCAATLQVGKLATPTCLALLAALDTGVSGHAAVQAKGRKLTEQAVKRLCRLLKNDDGALAADAGVQAALLAWLGPLQSMLNCDVRRTVFESVPFELLRVSWRILHVCTWQGLHRTPAWSQRLMPHCLQDCVLADDKMNADSEATGAWCWHARLAAGSGQCADVHAPLGCLWLTCACSACCGYMLVRNDRCAKPRRAWPAAGRRHLQPGAVPARPSLHAAGAL